LRQNTGKHSTVGVGRNVIVAHVNWWQGKPHSRQRGRNTKFTSRATILA
jgi:hypothetical protein